MKTKLLIAMSAMVLLYSIANPPWRITVKNSAGHIQRTELVWSYIGDQPRDPQAGWQSTAIATDVFAIQTIAVLVGIAAAFALIHAPRDTKTKPPSPSLN